MAAPAFLGLDPNTARLADPALREALLRSARSRLSSGEVDNLVQNTLTDALAASNTPLGDDDFQRWVHGIARHKIADIYRTVRAYPKPMPKSANKKTPSSFDDLQLQKQD